MSKLLEIGLIIIAASAVGVADAIIKKVSVDTSSFSAGLRSPWMFAIAALYILQILIFLYVFVQKSELGIVGIIQTALYAVIVVGSGVMLFNEKISLLQAIGMIFALAGVILMNLQ